MVSPPSSVLPPAPRTGSDTSPRASRSDRHVRIASMSSSASAALPKEKRGNRFTPPSPSSSSSALAVSSSQETGVIQSIEHGDCISNNLDDTRSLTESIRQHIIDGGLRYHAYHAGKYLFPNDETEQEREEMKHNLTLYLCDNEYFYAPVHALFEKGGDVLDLGTGTGRWCIDLADEYPNVEFNGMDLSPIQPDWVPENVLFVVDDIEHEAGWTYPENKFDYIHIRHTVHSIRNRPQLWERVFRHLKPGGYVEVQEFQYVAACDDDSCDGPYALRDFLRYLQEGMAALGPNLHGILFVEEELKAAGFQGLKRVNLKCPIGPWAKKPRLLQCGHVLRDVILWGLNGLARKPFRDGLKWTLVQIEMFLVEVRKALCEEVDGMPKYRPYFPFHSIYAQKPHD